MTEAEAYGTRGYAERVRVVYTPGQRVHVGEAYQGGGVYRHDGHEGLYVVLSRVGIHPDYRLARVWPNGEHGDTWDVIVHASRLIPEALA